MKCRWDNSSRWQDLLVRNSLLLVKHPPSKRPSAFTRPDHTAPITSSFAVADPSQNPTVQPVKSSKKYLRKVQAKSTIPTQSNRTSYTLETYQPPSPEWEYLTPWMVNMRTGTDELGWRYNAWFRKKDGTAMPETWAGGDG